MGNIPQYRPEGTGRGELMDYDLLVPNVELATGCAPMFLPGGPPSTLAQTLSTRVYGLVHSCGLVDVGELRIWNRKEGDEEMEGTEEGEFEAEREVVAYWTLYIDLLFVSLDGNPFDAAWAAVLAALRDTKLPQASWDVDREMVVCSRTEARPLTITGLPVACSAVVFLEKEHGLQSGGEGKHWVLMDPDLLEDSLCQENVTVMVDRSSGQTRVRSLEKKGGTVIGVDMMKELVVMAEKRWEEFKKAMP